MKINLSLSLLLALAAAMLLISGQALAQTGAATPAPTIVILTSTPQPDGSVVHEVAPGQALWSIAQAYGLSIDAINQLNNLATDAVLYAGDKLIVAPSFTPTSSPTVTNTLPPPTRTPMPTRTLRPPTLTPTPKPLVPPLEGDMRRSLGIGLIAVCALGIMKVIIHAVRSS